MSDLSGSPSPSENPSEEEYVVHEWRLSEEQEAMVKDVAKTNREMKQLIEVYKAIAHDRLEQELGHSYGQHPHGNDFCLWCPGVIDLEEAAAYLRPLPAALAEILGLESAT